MTHLLSNGSAVFFKTLKQELGHFRFSSIFHRKCAPAINMFTLLLRVVLCL